MPRTIFVVSQVGQVQHINATCIAEKISPGKTLGVILWTKANIKMAAQIEIALKECGFFNLRRLELPVRPARPTLNNINEIKNSYNRILTEISPDRMLVCNRSNHYSLLIKNAEERGIRVDLFEEGASSYRRPDKSIQGNVPSNISNELRFIFRKYWRRTIFGIIAAAAAKAIKDLINLPKVLFFTARELACLPFFQTSLIRSAAPEFFSEKRKFVTVYSTYPSVMQKLVAADSYIQIKPELKDMEKIEEARTLVARFNIESNTAIFASQKYDTEDSHIIAKTVAILERLASVTGLRILIKLHPREGLVRSWEYEEFSANSPMIEVIHQSGPPVEYILKNSRCGAIIAISSSSLIYGPLVNSKLRSISIGKELAESLTNKAKKSQGYATIKSDTGILRSFDYIEDSAKIVQ